MGGLLFCSEGGLFVLIAVSDRGYMMKIQCEGGKRLYCHDIVVVVVVVAIAIVVDDGSTDHDR